MDMTTLSSDKSYEYEEFYEGQTLCNISKPMEFGKIFNPVFFSFVFALSVFGNGLVVIILIKYENLKSITNVLILNLAISDLLVTTCLPFWFYYHISSSWSLGEAACKLVNFVFYIGFYSSGFLLILMTVHRYIAVVSPLSNAVSTEGLYSILAPVVVWVVSTVVSVPHFISTQVDEENFCGYVSNSPLSFWGLYQQIALFILTSFVFLFCYSKIILRLLRLTGQSRKTKTLKVIFTLMIVFFVGWAPYNVVTFLKYYNWENHHCDGFNALNYALDICRILSFSHCYLNPVFYVFVGVKFKNHLMRFFKGLGRDNSLKRSCSSVRSRQSRATVTSITSGEDIPPSIHPFSSACTVPGHGGSGPNHNAPCRSSCRW